MTKSFLQLVLDHKNIRQADAARLLSWSPQRVNYLCSKDAKGFPIDKIKHLSKRLGVCNLTMIELIERYLFNKK